MTAAGIWTRELKSRTGLQQQQLNKILKQLENRSLVKPVTSIQVRRLRGLLRR